MAASERGGATGVGAGNVQAEASRPTIRKTNGDRLLGDKGDSWAFKNASLYLK
jgi:hypothetical protein